MRLKIAVCDDDAIQRGYLCEVAAAWAKREKHLLELRQDGGRTFSLTTPRRRTLTFFSWTWKCRV